MAITVTERPPLELHAEVVTPAGTTVNWHSGATDPGDRPQGISFRTARFDGFKDGSCTLARRIDQPQLDLELFNMLRFVGANGDIAYEGRMAALPRSTGTPPLWTVQAAGLMANAKDRKFIMPFVDRDPSRWTAIPISRQAFLAGLGVLQGKIPAAAAEGGLTWTIPNESIPFNEISELYYDAGPGVTVKYFGYQGARTGAFTGFEAPALFSGGGTSIMALTLDDTPRQGTPSSTPRDLILRLLVSAGPVTPAAHLQRFSKLAVYGSHGLTVRAITGDLSGVFASDVIEWLIENYCPQLNARGIQATTYPIGHLAFHDRTHPYDAFLTVNAFHRWGLECWEGGTVHYAPLDLTDYDWELRLDDFGTSLSVSGPVAEEVANGIEVTYSDASTGQTKTLLPDNFAELRDSNPLNPLNRAGLYRPTDYTINSPATQDMALQIGRMALAEFNAPKHKGTATRQGYVKDRAGNWQPVWKVRAGDRVVITDSVDEEIHIVHETDYQHDSHTVSIAVDDTFQRLDAYLDRYANAVQAAGVG